MNIRKKTANIIFDKMWPTCLKLTLLLGGLGFILGALAIGPLTHKPFAYDISFTDEDMALFKEKEAENVERGLKYFQSEFDLWAGKKHIHEQIEKGSCIPSYFRNTADFRKYNRFKKEENGERKGKVSSRYLKGPLSNAINRTIDEVFWCNFNGGYLMKNSALESIGADHLSYSPDGYSIVTGGWEKFSYCKNFGIGLAIAGFLLPIVFIIGISILHSVIFSPGAWIYKASSRWIKWTFREFFK